MCLCAKITFVIKKREEQNLTSHIRSYVNDRFERVRAPRTKAVTALKKEIVKRLSYNAKYFVKHGMIEADAMNAAAKSLTNVKAPIRAALSAERKNESVHNRIKAVVIFFAMVCLVMSPFPVTKELHLGFVFAMGLIAAGVVLLVYSSKSTPKPVDVAEICDRFEIGMLRKNRRPSQETVSEPERVSLQQHRYKEEEESAFEEDELQGTVYSTTSKMLLVVSVAVYVLVSLITLKWVVCLMIFPICFSLTRLAKAFTDFFKSNSENEPSDNTRRKGTSR